MTEFFDYSRVKSSMLYFKNNYQSDNSYLICIRFNVDKNDYEHTTNYKYWNLCEKTIREVFKESLLSNVNNDFFILYKEKTMSIDDIVKTICLNLQCINYQFNSYKQVFNIGITLSTNDLKQDISKCLACILKAKTKNKIYLFDKDLNKGDINKVHFLIKNISKNNLIINNIELSNVKDVYSNSSNSLLYDLEYPISQIDFLSFKNLCDNYLTKGNYIYNFNPISLMYHSDDLINYIKTFVHKKFYNNFCINVRYCDNLFDNNLFVTNLIRLNLLGIKISLEINFIEDNVSLFRMMSYLKISYLKISRMILVKAINERRLYTILKCMYQMCNDLDIKIIFCDIEDKDEISFIKDNYPNALYKKTINKN